MIAAIYARKSTDQNVADEEKSVVDRARAYAAAKGWAVAEEHVYAGDGISGAEFLEAAGIPPSDERHETPGRHFKCSSCPRTPSSGKPGAVHQTATGLVTLHLRKRQRGQLPPLRRNTATVSRGLFLLAPAQKSAPISPRLGTDLSDRPSQLRPEGESRSVRLGRDQREHTVPVSRLRVPRRSRSDNRSVSR
jgi:hypothetical protein